MAAPPPPPSHFTAQHRTAPKPCASYEGEGHGTDRPPDMSQGSGRRVPSSQAGGSNAVHTPNSNSKDPLGRA